MLSANQQQGDDGVAKIPKKGVKVSFFSHSVL
jgi:hypothetical protein